MPTPTIGLEIHAELNTKTKMFCDCVNDPEDTRPNAHTCPVCLAHPGALPTPNKEAIASVITVGLAFDADIAKRTKFDRKNYFYPDLPKGYQISQYDEPLVSGGKVQLPKTGAMIRVRRIHLEEDTGRLLHANGSSLVDYNRAGVPLMELVTEPDFRTGAEVTEFAEYLQLVLRYLGVSNADMEKGQMRVEANVSIDMGTKVELKNINSFRAVRDAIDYEISRQSEALAHGEQIVQETRGWDDAKKSTFSQRTKEEAHDYRYFPEPDLAPIDTSVFHVTKLKKSLPELPYAKRDRFMGEYGLTEAQAYLLVWNPELANFFESAESELAYRDQDETSEEHKAKTRTLLYNYLTSDLAGVMNEKSISLRETNVSPEHLAHLVDLIADGKIMSRQAKDILKAMVADGSDPEDILEREGLHTVSDESELVGVIRAMIAENEKAVADYRSGKEASMQFLIGKAMGALKGRANPATLRALFEAELKK